MEGQKCPGCGRADEYWLEFGVNTELTQRSHYYVISDGGDQPNVALQSFGVVLLP